jgi:hypothetical protein
VARKGAFIMVTIVALLLGVGMGDVQDGRYDVVAHRGPLGHAESSNEPVGAEWSLPQRAGNPCVGSEALPFLYKWKDVVDNRYAFALKVTRIVYSYEWKWQSVSLGYLTFTGAHTCSLDLIDLHVRATGVARETLLRKSWTFNGATVDICPGDSAQDESHVRAQKPGHLRLDYIPIPWLVAIDPLRLLQEYDIGVVRTLLPAGVRPFTGVRVPAPRIVYQIVAIPNDHSRLGLVEIILNPGTFLPETIRIDMPQEGPIIYYIFAPDDRSEAARRCSDHRRGGQPSRCHVSMKVAQRLIYRRSQHRHLVNCRRRWRGGLR